MGHTWWLTQGECTGWFHKGGYTGWLHKGGTKGVMHRVGWCSLSIYVYYIYIYIHILIGGLSVRRGAPTEASKTYDSSKKHTRGTVS